MSGWIMLAAIALFTGLLLWAIGFPMRLWTIAATALTLGATGYAWQGSPGVPGYNAASADKTTEIDPAMVEMREMMFGRFNFAWQQFGTADAMIRHGNPALAVAIMHSAVGKGPQDGSLWTGLGMALAEHDRGVSPASRFAFDKAMALWPTHPGPPYFLAISYARMGQLVEARGWLAKAVERAPATLSYRPALVAQLEQLDGMIAARSGGAVPVVPPVTSPAP